MRSKLNKIICPDSVFVWFALIGRLTICKRPYLHSQVHTLVYLERFILAIKYFLAGCVIAFIEQNYTAATLENVHFLFAIELTSSLIEIYLFLRLC